MSAGGRHALSLSIAKCHLCEAESSDPAMSAGGMVGAVQDKLQGILASAHVSRMLQLEIANICIVG